jgi:hypothetical protein
MARVEGQGWNLMSSGVGCPEFTINWKGCLATNYTYSNNNETINQQTKQFYQ